MKDQPKTTHLSTIHPLRNAVKGSVSTYQSISEQLGYSLTHVNQVMLAWLATVGTATAGQSDEHLNLVKIEQKR